MKTILIATSTLVAGLALATTASAQNWVGPYVGAHVAYHSGEIDDTGCTGLCVADHEVQEAYLAIQGGYDMPMGENMIIGVMGWVGVTPVKDQVTLAPGVVVNGETDFAGFIGVRVGADRGNWLPYAFIGYEHVTGNVQIPAAPTPNNDGKHTGLGVGVGAEFRRNDAWAFDARYMYSDLGDDNYNFGGGTTVAGEQAHTFSAGVNYRFGR